MLWSFKISDVDDGVFDSLVRNVLLEEKSGVSSYSVDLMNVKWKQANDLGLIFAIAYQGIVNMNYLETLLEQLQTTVSSQLDPSNLSDLSEVKVDFRLLSSKSEKLAKSQKKAPMVKSSKAGGPKKGKQARDWDGKPSEITDLDFSKNDGTQEAKRTYLPDSSEDELEMETPPLPHTGIFAKLTARLQSFTGNKQLVKDDMKAVLDEFTKSLINKNVASEVAEKIAASVESSLIGSRTEKFTSVHATVKAALTQAIETVLTPKKSVDVLKAALDAKASNKVYTIVFIGVNGVGKSTNLSKVAYMLKNKGGLKVLIAACDTFRAGAVEQLRTHSKCLDIDLFEKGYGKDAADIAKQAICHAEKNSYDVVLVDTAGRMQDNEPLMRSLSKLTAINSPDLVLFVGEALVGHDAIDQLTKFNRALLDFSDKQHARGIDGIILTKYDTVDDKVGAAVSMVYITGQPVVFVGTGQKYTNLKKLQVSEVVASLLA